MKLRSGSERRIYSPCAHHPRSPHNIGIASPAPSYQGWRVSGYRPGDSFLITICLSLRSVLPLSCQLNLFVATRQEEGKSRALPQLFCPVLSDRHPGLIAIKIVGSLRAAIIPVNYDLVSRSPVSSFFWGSGQFC